MGSFLGTFHKRGVALWGGPALEKQGRFAHDDVNRLSFSPCERYMLTCAFHPREDKSTVCAADAPPWTCTPVAFARRSGPLQPLATP
jgi:uncharacterized protein with WD repeat